MTIEYFACDEVGRCGKVFATERARIEELPVGFGGVRRWVCCPGCGKRCRVIYGVWALRCRKCAGLRYQCHMLQKHDRAYQQATKIARRCHPRARWGDGMPAKPKWMRWPTYESLATQYGYLESIGILAGLPAQLDRTGRFRNEAAAVQAEYQDWRRQSSRSRRQR